MYEHVLTIKYFEYYFFMLMKLKIICLSFINVHGKHGNL